MSFPKLCSSCIQPLQVGKHTMYVHPATDRPEATPMGFCNLRCLAVWAIEKGWAKQ